MDRFDKYALILMVSLVAVMLIVTYVGYSVYGSSVFETRYITVIEDQAKQLGMAFGHPIELGIEGEYIGFTLAGVAAGLVMGYLIPSVFRAEETK
jgi:hypothetical protein